MSAGIQAAPARFINKQAHISVQRYFEISLLLMLGTGFLTLASTGKLDPVSIALFPAALGIKLWGYVRGESGYRLSARTVNRLSLLYLFFFLLDFLFLAPGPGPLDRMLAAAVHLILFVTVIKIFAARRYRDYGYLAALSFLMMLAGAVLTVSASYLIGLTAYVLFAISMFISYDVKRGIEMAWPAPKGPYADPVRNRLAIENSLGMTALGLALGIAMMGAILFFLIPRYHTSYFSNFNLETQNVTGFSESVNLGDIGRIKRSNLVVMRVKISGNPDRFQGIRWRGIGLTSFTGRTWYDDNIALKRLGPVSPGRFVLPLEENWQRRPESLIRYQVLLSSVSTDVVFAAAEAREISGNFPALEIDETGSLHDPHHLGAPTGYTAISNIALPAAALLRGAGENYGEQIRARYLSVPKPDPELAALASRITKSSSNNYDRALAVQNYLRTNYGYTLDPLGIQPADPVDSFLFKSRKGYCAYFAAAMTLMLRTLNIPARIVNGFQTGTYNPIGQDFVVRARDAHSWVE
ncbi:MAG: transglutaminaseTgpA domain-containing protein, partial [Terriglobia bacterium]